MKLRTHLAALKKARCGGWLMAGATLLAACAGPITRQAAAPALAPLPPLVTAGAARYRVRSALSDVRFLVYRAGPLAAFGHDHVIRAGTIRGAVYLNRDFALSGFELALPVADFRVDEPAVRAQEGVDFTTRPSAAAVAGTLKNMLGPAVLDAARYPEIRVRSVRLSGPEWGPDVTIRITLRGAARELRVPVAVGLCGARLTATGSFELRQSDFGLTPFSILGGGLRVADRVRVRFHIVAERDGASAGQVPQNPPGAHAGSDSAASVAALSNGIATQASQRSCRLRADSKR